MPRQTDIIDRLEPGSRIAILRLRSLGDCILTTPAIDLLHGFRPDLEIGVCVQTAFAGVFAGNPAVKATFEPAARALRAFDPVLCLNLHGGTRSARLTLLSGARYRAGFEIFRPGWIYNTPIPTSQEILGITRRVHTAEHMASAMFHLGVPISEIPRASIYPPEGRSAHGPGGRYAVFHAMAATPEKTWPGAFYMELARYVSREYGLEPVFIGGPGEDLSQFQMWRTVSSAPLPELARLMRDASFFVGNDSGPAHLAAAFGVPELVFFGPSDAEIWSPWKTRHQVLKAEPIHSISVDEACRAVDRMRIGSKLAI